MTSISLLCPSNRPKDLERWLDSLYENCSNPKDIQICLTVEEMPRDKNLEGWGNTRVRLVKPKQYAINELVEICYKQAMSPFIFLSGDDTICRTKNWDKIFLTELNKYPDNVVLVYPDDMIFGKELACYPVTSRLVMDKIPFPLPFKRYAIDDTIFDIVPKTRRVYLPNVVMEHLHLNSEGPGVPVTRDGVVKYYPINKEVMEQERPLYQAMEPERTRIRKELEAIAGIKTKIMIGLSTAEFGRRADFYDGFNTFLKPADTFISFVHGQSPARSRNLIIQQAIDNECTHIFFLDDDVVIPPDTLMKLLADDKDIVSGLYLMRNHPHNPIAFDTCNEDGRCNYIDLNKYPGQNLVEIKAAGLGCLLVKTDVFRNMEKPWVRLGELELDMWCDDIGMFKRIREAGFKAYLDTTVLIGHQASMTIYPIKQDGQFKIAYDTSGATKVTV